MSPFYSEREMNNVSKFSLIGRYLGRVGKLRRVIINLINDDIV